MQTNVRATEFQTICDLIGSALRYNIFKVLLITGFPGCGKTYTVKMVVSERDYRSKAVYINCIQQEDYCVEPKNKIIILDEVDQAIKSNKTKFTEYVDTLKKHKIVLILISNQMNVQLPFNCEAMQFAQFNQDQLKQIAVMQLARQGIKEGDVDSQALNYLIQQVVVQQNSDVRFMEKCIKALLKKGGMTVHGVNQLIMQVNNQLHISPLDYYQANILKTLLSREEDRLTPMELTNYYEEMFDEECRGLHTYLQKLENINLVRIKRTTRGGIQYCEVDRQVAKAYKPQLDQSCM